MQRMKLTAVMLVGVFAAACSTTQAEPENWVVYGGGDGPGAGKKIVLISGDEEYRSEEGLPQLGKILAKRHGFKCSVHFAIDPKTGEINPNNQNNIPGLEALDDADLMIILTRFRDLPDDQMKHIDAYVQSGKPIIGLRTSTHAFNIKGNKTYSHYSFRSKAEGWKDGFGRQILGETWINHHGGHKSESTRGIIPDDVKDHPILSGIESGDIWGASDVYGVRLPLPDDSKPLVLGQVLKRDGKADKNDRNFGMKPTDTPVEGKKNDPMMPVAWTKSYQAPDGKAGKAFTTTMGSSTDLENEALRRLIVNAAYHLLGMDVPDKADVRIVGEYHPTAYGFNAYTKGVKPSDHAMK